MIKIYLVRHGETTWNRSGTWQGWTNVPLNERGLSQADCCAKALRGLRFAYIISSDLDRARVTAEKIAFYHKEAIFQTDKRLRELHFGEWEGLTFDEINEKWPGQIDEMYSGAGTVQIPGGESFLELQDRSFKALEEVLAKVKDGDAILCVCHGGTNRALICRLLRIDLNHAWNFRQGNTAISIIDYYGDTAFNSLSLLNDIAHLNDLEGEELEG